MTIGEVYREAERLRNEQKNKAYFDYTQAITISKLVGIMISGKGKVPEIYDVYPDLYDKQQIEQQKSVANFMNFANAFNSKWKEKTNGR